MGRLIGVLIILFGLYIAYRGYKIPSKLRGKRITVVTVGMLIALSIGYPVYVSNSSSDAKKTETNKTKKESVQNVIGKKIITKSADNEDDMYYSDNNNQQIRYYTDDDEKIISIIIDYQSGSAKLNADHKRFISDLKTVTSSDIKHISGNRYHSDRFNQDYKVVTKKDATGLVSRVKINEMNY